MILDRRDIKKYMGNCSYCKKYSELRPYGRGGQKICYDCGTLPENIQETQIRMQLQLQDEFKSQIKNN